MLCKCVCLCECAHKNAVGGGQRSTSDVFLKFFLTRVCVCRYVCIVHACACVHRDQKSMMNVFLSHIFNLFIEAEFLTEPGVQHLMGLGGQQAQGPPSVYQPLRNRFTPPCPDFLQEYWHLASGPHIWVPCRNIFTFSLMQSETEMPLIPRVSIALWKTHRTWVSIMMTVIQASATYTLAGLLTLLFSHLLKREVMKYILQNYLTHHGHWLCVTQSQHL